MLSRRDRPSHDTILETWSQHHGHDPQMMQMEQFNRILCICVAGDNTQLAGAVCQHSKFPRPPTCSDHTLVPLWHALQKDNDVMIRILLEGGYDPSRPVKGFGCHCGIPDHLLNVLQKAISQGQVCYIDKLLVENKPVLSLRMHLLRQACFSKCEVATKTLDHMLARGVYCSLELDQFIDTGEVPLFLAAKNNLKTFFVLLKHGADARKLHPIHGTVLDSFLTTVSITCTYRPLRGHNPNQPAITSDWDEVLLAIELMLNQGVNTSIRTGLYHRYPLCRLCECYGEPVNDIKFKGILRQLTKCSSREAIHLAFCFVMNEICKFPKEGGQRQLMRRQPFRHWPLQSIHGVQREMSCSDIVILLMHMAIIILNHGSAQYHNDSMDLQMSNNTMQTVLPDELLSNNYEENIAHLLRLYPHAIQHGTMNECLPELHGT